MGAATKFIYTVKCYTAVKIQESSGLPPGHWAKAVVIPYSRERLWGWKLSFSKEIVRSTATTASLPCAEENIQKWDEGESTGENKTTQQKAPLPPQNNQKQTQPLSQKKTKQNQKWRKIGSCFFFTIRKRYQK